MHVNCCNSDADIVMILQCTDTLVFDRNNATNGNCDQLPSSCCICDNAHKCAYTYTCVHTCTCVRIHAHVHTHACVYTNMTIAKQLHGHMHGGM